MDVPTVDSSTHVTDVTDATALATDPQTCKHEHQLQDSASDEHQNDMPKIQKTTLFERVEVLSLEKSNSHSPTVFSPPVDHPLETLDCLSNIEVPTSPEASGTHTRQASVSLPAVPPCSPTTSDAAGSLSSKIDDLLSPPTSQQSTPNLTIDSYCNSPLADQNNDSDHTTDDSLGESGSTTSIEIISNCPDDSFVSDRFDLPKDRDRVKSMSQDGTAIQSAPSSSNLLSPPDVLIKANDTHPSSRPPIERTVSDSTAKPTRPPLEPMQKPEELVCNAEFDTVSLQLFQPNNTNRDQSPFRDSDTYYESGMNGFEKEDQSLRVDAVLKTPNVYINGLPPHFPDESLYMMTRDFGNVLSVRTFTRCVGDKMSGYGFVLFDTVDSAERCIDSLRKYRNLHPSFSKQIHKIPGTPYASGTITLPPTSTTLQPNASALTSLSSASTLASQSSSGTLFDNSTSDATFCGHKISDSSSSSSFGSISEHGNKDMSFREKMERLRDERSTNLYMEGLPLTIDEYSLAALVSPFRIVSSRFFQTKLSNPPRMIAFVRLESRQAAEEIVERLHGRVVRGWNDNGCRIAVRFADSNEQRELRRAERLARGDDEDLNGTGRLSMAQAALLNLRGAELQANMGPSVAEQHAQGTNVSSYGGRSSSIGQSNLAVGARWPLHYTNESGLSGHGTASERANKRNCDMDVSTFTSSYRGSKSSRPDSTNLTQLVPNNAMHLVQEQAGFDLNDFSSTNIFSSSVAQESLAAKHAAQVTHLAMLQQQTRLQQIELLRQRAALQGSMNSTSSVFQEETIGHATRPSNLMPAADIHSPQLGETSIMNAASHNITLQQSSGMDAFNSANLLSMASTLQAIGSPEQFYDIREDFGYDESQGHNKQNGHHQRQLLKEQHRAAPLGGISSPFSRTSSTYERKSGKAHHHHYSIGGLPGLRSVHRLENSEESDSVSPTLTFSSRTPSTLSPATPLFQTNSFGTPASAPSTIPSSRSYVKEREHLRSYKNDLRH